MPPIEYKLAVLVCFFCVGRLLAGYSSFLQKDKKNNGDRRLVFFSFRECSLHWRRSTAWRAGQHPTVFPARWPRVLAGAGLFCSSAKTHSANPHTVGGHPPVSQCAFAVGTQRGGCMAGDSTRFTPCGPVCHGWAQGHRHRVLGDAAWYRPRTQTDPLRAGKRGGNGCAAVALWFRHLGVLSWRFFAIAHRAEGTHRYEFFPRRRVTGHHRACRIADRRGGLDRPVVFRSPAVGTRPFFLTYGPATALSPNLRRLRRSSTWRFPHNDGEARAFSVPRGKCYCENLRMIFASRGGAINS